MAAPILSLETEAMTAQLGAKLAPLIRAGDVICLSGNLGAGKSTLARGLIEKLTGEKEAPSPTYMLVETYDAGDFELWHFDLYRLERPEEVYELGLEEALSEGAALIEWPERIEAFLPESALTIRLEIDGARRTATFAGNEEWRRRLERSGIASW